MHENAEDEVSEALRTLLSATRLDLAFVVRKTEDVSPRLCVELSGLDSATLVERNGELLLAIEHVAAKMIGLQPHQHDLLSLDAHSFKANRENVLLAMAAHGATEVGQTGKPFTFSPMSSHQRRRLHLALAESGLETASTGEGAQRAVVLYPRRA